jgi:hypothetical protein
MIVSDAFSAAHASKCAKPEIANRELGLMLLRLNPPCASTT